MPVGLPSTVAIAEISLSHSLINEGAGAGMIVDPQSMSGPVISFGGDEELERRQPTPPEVLPAAMLGGGAPEAVEENQAEVTNSRPAATLSQTKRAAQAGSDGQTKPFHIEQEIGRLLNNRRWEKRDSPFDGFNSPPGRF
jgi:hypothetical protein